MVDGQLTRARRRRAARGRGGDLREEVLGIAVELLTGAGDEREVTIRAVADAAGITAPSIYLHFADKAALVAAVLERLGSDLDTALDAAVEAANAAGEPPVARVLARAHAFVEHALTHPGRYTALYEARRRGAARTPVEVTPGRAGLEASRADLQQAMDAGQVPPADAQAVVVLVWQLLHGIVSLRINKPDYPWAPAHDDTETGVRALLRLPSST